MSNTERSNSTLSLLASAALVAVLTGAAYFGGAALARLWTMPSLALPAQPPPAEPDSPAAEFVELGETVEGRLETGEIDEWLFQGQADRAATIEMWFHPGLGSSTEAELLVRLIAPGGETLTEEIGSVFLPPHLFHDTLPETGSYRIQVLPVSGSPGRYSLSVSMSDGTKEFIAEVTPQHHATSAAPQSSVTAHPHFQWPTDRRAISGWTFHDPRNPGHIGLDITAKTWDPIVACTDGSVIFAEWGGGYGNLVILNHENGWSSYYAHLTEIAVTVGQDVRQGETLGGAGTTGYSTGPHLHFELRYRGRPVDPHVYLP